MKYDQHEFPQTRGISTQERIGIDWHRFIGREENQIRQLCGWPLHRCQEYFHSQTRNVRDVDLTNTVAALEYGNDVLFASLLDSRHRRKWQEARPASRPACPSRVFCLYRQAGDSGRVVIQKQYFAIVDRRISVTATHLLFLHIDIYGHRSQILLVGCHRGACRLISLGLHHIKSLNNPCGMTRKGRTSVGSHQSRGVHDFLPSATHSNGNLLGLVT